MAGELERNYECPRCEMRAIVVIEAAAEKTPWQRTEDRMLLGRGDGMARQDDASRTLGLVRCPSCGTRSRLALPVSVLRVIGYSFGALLVFGMAGRGLAFTTTWYAPVCMTAGLVGGTLMEVRRWAAAGNARVVRMIRGPAELPLPKAIAKVSAAAPALPAPAAPKVLPPPPVARPVARAPEPVERAAPSDGPRLLK